MSKQALAMLAYTALAGKIPMQVLRGLGDPEREDGDIDFIVPPGAAIQACLVVAQEAQRNNWHLVSIRNLKYVCTIVLVKPHASEKDEAVKLDFIDGLAWRGFAGKGSFANPFSPEWDSIHEGWTSTGITGALTFLQKIMSAGSVSEKEWARIAASGTDVDYLANIASEFNLPLSRTQIEERKLSGFAKWKLRAKACGVTNPVTALWWFAKSILAHSAFKLGWETATDLVLGISGLDGSGKSTLVDRFIAVLHKADAYKPKLVHFLPSWIPMPHQIARRKKTQSNYTKPYAEPPVSSRLNGNLRLVYYLCAFALARLFLGPFRKRGQLIILDRCFLDFASDLARARIPDRRLPQGVVRLLMPAGMLFFLDAMPETVVARKGELKLEKAKTLQSQYLETTRVAGGSVLNGEANPEEVFSEFLQYVSTKYLQSLQVLAARKPQIYS